jgi:hypothetical protein
MEKLTSILEIIYFLSGPALVIAAIYGLKQLKLASEQNKQIRQTRILNSTREAYTLAGDQCKYYLENIIPLINKLDQIIKDKNLDFFEKSEVKIKGEQISVKPYMADNSLDKVFEECLEELHTVVNYIEGFSVFFVSGVAADNVGFNTLGRTYTSTVKRLLPFIIPFGQDGTYKHTKSLFITWYSRIEKDNLLKEKAEVEKKLKKQKSITIDTIGTK